MQYLFLVLSSTLFLLLTYTTSFNELTINDSLLILFVFCVVISVELVITIMISKFHAIQKNLITLFILINIISFHALFIEELVYLKIYQQVLLLLINYFVIFTFISIVNENKLFSKIINLVILIAICGTLYNSYIKQTNNLLSIIPTSGTHSENIRLINFTSTPNVYFVAFDALIPQSIFNMYFTDSSAPFHQVFDKNFSSFTNFFTDAAPTKPSLNALLALDPDYYNNHKETLFNGTAPSPFFEVFKHNGYEVSTAYWGTYFGEKQGPFVDNYNIGDNTEGICQFLNQNLKSYTLYGYCEYKYFLETLLLIPQEHTVTLQDYVITKLYDDISINTPHVSLSYIFSPGHAPIKQKLTGDELDEYTKSYIEYSKYTVEHIHKLMKFIDEKDPTAILFVFGDHGTFTSNDTDKLTDTKYFIHDRYAVYGGIYPKDRCHKYFTEQNNKKYTTIIQASQMIFKCLSNGQDIFINQKEWNHVDYEQYLYE